MIKQRRFFLIFHNFQGLKYLMGNLFLSIAGIIKEEREREREHEPLSKEHKYDEEDYEQNHFNSF